MSSYPAAPTTQSKEEREPTLFDSLSRLVPEELQTAYYRVLAHTRTLNPDDEMLRILEAMGVLALLTRQTPREIADEREHIQETFVAHQQFSEAVQQKMLDYVHELESRISALPDEIEAGLDPQQIAKMLGESLRQHFLKSGIPDTVKGLQATTATMTSTQKELSTALYHVSDSRDGIVAQIEQANSRLTYSLEKRAKTIDALLHEWKTDLLRIWIPMVVAASMLVGLFGGMEIQGCRDATVLPSTPIAEPAEPAIPPQVPAKPPEHPRRPAK